MDIPSEALQSLILLGALCVGAAIAGVVCGMRRGATPWPTYFVLMSVAFAVFAACTTVSVFWMQWIDYDRGIRASMESAKERGYEIHESVRSDGTVVFRIKNYVVPDGSFSIVANRTPFRPDWAFIGIWSSSSGLVAAFVALVSRRFTFRYAVA